MKTKPIFPDALTLRSAGVRTLTDMIVLVHLGRCGISGATVNGCADALRLNHNTVYTSLERLTDVKLVTRVSVIRKQGLPALYVVTVSGWNALTKPADYSLFSGADGKAIL